MSTRGLLDALSHALWNPASQSAAATVFSLLTVDIYRPIILYALIDIIRNPNSHPRSIKDALKALFGISLYPLNRATVIELGAIPALFSLVVKDGRLGVVEDATVVIAGCEEADDAFRKVLGVGVLLDLLTGSSGRTKENMVQCGKKEVGEYVKEMSSIVCNGINDVAENGSLKGKSKDAELLKLIDSGSGFQEVQLDNVITQSP